MPRRALFARPTLLAAAVALGACGSHDGRDETRRALRAERASVRDAAERAAALATGGDDSARSDSARARRHAGVRLGGESGAGLVRGGDPPMGRGDVRVVSTDGTLVLALVGDTVRMRLGDRMVHKVRHELDAEPDTVQGLGGFISRTVKGAVGGAMAEAARFAVRIPVSEVRDLRYEDGELRFGSGHKRGTHSNARFAPADAERFIQAVRARQRALGVPLAGG